MKNKTRTVTLIIVSATDKAVKCYVPGKDATPFFLPKSQIKPLCEGNPRRNQPCRFEIPEWLALNHRQICGDAAFEANKKDRR